MKARSISFVVKDKLCTMCGTCAGICPLNAIDMIFDHKRGVYEPDVIEDRCTDCGICVDCCIGHKVAIGEYRSNATREVQIDRHFGRFVSILRANSTNKEIRNRGASGGVVTSILTYLFSKELIDAAVVTRMDQEDPVKVVPYIAYNADALIPSQKSKYSPTPLNTILRECLSDRFDGKRIAYVGLPCHIEGLRSAQQRSPELRKRITISISLFCHHMPTRVATEYLMYLNKIRLEDLQAIDYRGSGKPGKLRFVLKDGSEIFIPHLHWSYWGYTFLKFFILRRCWLCYDKCGEMADISVGDNWQNYRVEMEGAATLLTRSRGADQLMHDIAGHSYINIHDMSLGEFVNDQDLEKTYELSPRLDLCKHLGIKVPLYGGITSSSKPFTRLKAAIPALQVLISEHSASLSNLDIVIRSFYLCHKTKTGVGLFMLFIVRKLLFMLFVLRKLIAVSTRILFRRNNFTV